MDSSTTLLLAAHGSRHPEGNDEIRRFAGEWQKRHPAWRIEVCFIEHAAVLLAEGLQRAARGARQVLVVPLILNAAGHVKMELPAAMDAARVAYPQVSFHCARHLGMGRQIFAVLQGQLARLMKSLAMPDPQTTGVILLGRGSSDAGANGELAKLTRWLFEDNEHELVDLAFTGVTWPRLETVVQRQVRLGMTQIAIVPVYLFNGVLIERIKAQVERLQKQYPQIAFAAGSYFGFDQGIFDLLDARVSGRELPSGALLECDGCKYRQAAEAEQLHDHSHTQTPTHLVGAGHAHAGEGHVHPHDHDDHQHVHI
ncbi:MAG: Sirohydrochlorin cobaltochelatase [Candidatus Accumulibacter regalis]|jgi:sirohydrochlorin cobaltochelatase|uniref:Sirohydrochlorin cobaltochelatase n=1 Tax=Accumulibacter regalis TaxID=522306 RepID=A0A011NMQ4_ACCRE|nr:sirohydrochlorin chelatase [Accumulibacter sp.]EXI83973.1 MAG: Sirohydrochlorin cobaltochelatase [Candidatus Accumulibacter regalis]MBL8369667.1 sirohydrochlorin chelatase [Accumulibacter sp.]HRE72314.1 sirohydrochlorin chelatase [Accumulibacter sp.]HRE86965.1 sirohydrochlorin chelatase [Accumulibacter sp.]